jgi:hypothetical protein
MAPVCFVKKNGILAPAAALVLFEVMWWPLGQRHFASAAAVVLFEVMC